jgi:tRNA threonylcarbamoyladenosine biosynthesis protein TsaE
MQLAVSLDQLDHFAKQFWEYVKDEKVFAFHGRMGAGKTTLITALCKEKGVKEAMSSPTFSIINEYVFDQDGHQDSIFHIDLYRLNTEDEIVQTGVEDTIYSGAICMVEWPEKAPGLFDDRHTVHVSVQPVSETERRIEVRLPLQA